MTQRLARISYLVKDYDIAIAWFQTKLGFELVENTALGSGKRWVVMAPQGAKGCGASLLLAQATSLEQAGHIGKAAGGRVAFFLHTDDFARDHAAMLAKGVTFREAPRHEAYGTVAVFEDLYGNLWDLLEAKT